MSFFNIFFYILDASENLDIKGKTIHLSMLHNPSHLEAVNPVSMGKARSKQMTSRDGAFSDDKAKEFSNSVLNVQVICFLVFKLETNNFYFIFLYKSFMEMQLLQVKD